MSSPRSIAIGILMQRHGDGLDQAAERLLLEAQVADRAMPDVAARRCVYGSPSRRPRRVGPSPVGG